VVLVLLLLLYTVAYSVSFRQIAIVDTFGKAGEPIDGSRGDAGLHFKLPWPIQKLTRYDSRMFMFDDTHEQLQTSDKQNVLITLFCGWRIADAAQFFRTLETEAAAEDTLRTIVRAKKGDVIGRQPLSALLNTDPRQMRIPRIEDEIRQAVEAETLPKYGVEVVTLGIKTLGLPKTVTERVIESMKTERNRYAERYRAEGKAQADVIRTRAQAAREQILAFAEARGQVIRAQGKAEAAKLYEAYRRNERFAMFLKELEFLRKTLKDNTVILGDAWLQHSLGFFRDGASLPPLQSGATTRPARP